MRPGHQHHTSTQGRVIAIANDREKHTHREAETEGAGERGREEQREGHKARPQTADSPPPPCISYALVHATVGVGTVLIWDLILIRYQT